MFETYDIITNFREKEETNQINDKGRKKSKKRQKRKHISTRICTPYAASVSATNLRNHDTTIQRNLGPI